MFIQTKSIEGGAGGTDLSWIPGVGHVARHRFFPEVSTWWAEGSWQTGRRS